MAGRSRIAASYYEAFNQENVELVSILETPIERVTETGIQTSAALHEFDLIVYATGFDAITGSFDRIEPGCIDDDVEFMVRMARLDAGLRHALDRRFQDTH